MFPKKINEHMILDISLNQKLTPLALQWIDRQDKGLHFQVPRVLVQAKLK
jgi:hypothetical protein